MMTSTDPEALEDEGRQVRLEPLPAGSWLLLLGCGAMLLGPLFGFLVGTMLGVDNKTLGMSPIFFFLFVGFMVAGLGLGVALLGVRRLISGRRAIDADADVDAVQG